MVSYEYNSEYAAGNIFYQSYSQGSYVDPGTVVEIKVSQGPMPTDRPVTYYYSDSIAAPTAEEAPDYVPGSDVSISIVTDDGEVLREADHATFPYSVNFSGIRTSGGTITMTYTVTKPGETTTDPETGESVAGAPTTEQRSFTRRIEFKEE